MRQADVFGPGNAILLVSAQFFNTEMRADATEAVIGENSFEFGTFVFGKAAEAEFLVADRRTQLDRLKAGVGKLLDGAGKIFGNHFFYGPGLAADRETERICAELESACSQEADCGGLCSGVLQERSP